MPPKLVVLLAVVSLISSADAQLFKSRTPAARRPPQPIATPQTRATPAAPTPVPTPKVLVALPNYDTETSTRLQIFLDNNWFGPGKIDGEMGEFFRKALIAYKRAHGMPETGAVDQWLIDQVPVALTNYTIAPDDAKFVGITASKPSEQARLKQLPYGSYLEFVAERFHASEAFLRKLNPGKNLDQLQPGDSLTVPNVLPFQIEKLSEAFVPENPASPHARSLSIRKSAHSRCARTDSWWPSFPSLLVRRLCRRLWERGRFSASRRCRGSGTTRVC